MTKTDTSNYGQPTNNKMTEQQKHRIKLPTESVAETSDYSATSVTTAAENMPDELSSVLRILSHTRMVGPALLFLAGHRPLAFAASQLLYAFQPIAELFDAPTIADVANILSKPDGATHLETALARADESRTPANQPPLPKENTLSSANR